LTIEIIVDTLRRPSDATLQVPIVSSRKVPLFPTDPPKKWDFGTEFWEKPLRQAIDSLLIENDFRKALLERLKSVPVAEKCDLVSKDRVTRAQFVGPHLPPDFFASDRFSVVVGQEKFGGYRENTVPKPPGFLLSVRLRASKSGSLGGQFVVWESLAQMSTEAAPANNPVLRSAGR
jgi:hypothetical protein